MIKLYIFNLEEFLCLADRCSGPVNLLSEGGKLSLIHSDAADD